MNDNPRSDQYPLIELPLARYAYNLKLDYALDRTGAVSRSGHLYGVPSVAGWFPIPPDKSDWRLIADSEKRLPDGALGDLDADALAYGYGRIFEPSQRLAAFLPQLVGAAAQAVEVKPVSPDRPLAAASVTLFLEAQYSEPVKILSGFMDIDFLKEESWTDDLGLGFRVTARTTPARAPDLYIGSGPIAAILAEDYGDRAVRYLKELICWAKWGEPGRLEPSFWMRFSG
jgi:hypothetical protein